MKITSTAYYFRKL